MLEEPAVHGRPGYLLNDGEALAKGGQVILHVQLHSPQLILCVLLCLHSPRVSVQVWALLQSSHCS